MADADPFNRWLDDFRRHVDPALERSAQPTLSTPEGRQAQEAFDAWWSAEQQPVTSPSVSFTEPDEATPRHTPSERLLPQEWPIQVERLADDRARLQQKVESLGAENRSLRGRLSQVQSEIADFETKLSRSRQSYEEHIQRLEAQAKTLEEQLAALRGDKAFLETALNRAADDHKLSQNQAALDRQRADQAEDQLLDLHQRHSATAKEVSELKEKVSAQAGALEELRRQLSLFIRKGEA